jgi:hypothetical protein
VNAAVAAAQRKEAVRAAARAWHEAGFIDETTLAGILRRYPNDRRRAGLAFRVLLLAATLVCGGAAFGLLGVLMDSPAAGWFALAAFAALTEVAVVSWRFTGRGPEEATAVLTFVAGLVAAFWCLDKWLHLSSRAGEGMVFLSVVLLAAAIVWRWGMPVFGVPGAACLIWWLGRFAGGRVTIVLVALAMCAVAYLGARSPRLAPAHRMAATFVLLTALAFLYLALNLVSYDSQWVERTIAESWNATADPALRPLFVAATALLPAAVVGVGIWLRDRGFLLGGTLMVVLSLVTIRKYVHVAPLWVLLTAGGLLAMGIAAALRRFLDSGQGQERRGFTALPLDQSRSQEALVETAVALATLQPTPRKVETPVKPDFEGGGGQLGGGGASGDF